ncbi:ERCC4 domain-containing protein [Aspergillus venezuelensis]
MAPEVINLLSSTPPPHSAHRDPSPFRRFQSSPPAPSEYSNSNTNPVHLLSDDIDIGQFDYDEIGSSQPSKRRRITPEPEPEAATTSGRNNGGGGGGGGGDGGNALPSRNRNSLFSFSDDIVLSSDGPGLGPSNALAQAQAQSRTPYKPPAWPLDSDPIVFTSSAPEPSRRDASPAKNKSRITEDALLDSDPDFGNILGALGKRNGKGKGKAPWDNIEDFSDPVRIPDSDDVFDLVEEGASKVPAMRSEFSGRTADLLASLGNGSKGRSSGTGVRGKQKSRVQEKDVDVDEDPDVLPESLVRKPKKTTAATKRTTADKEEKAKGREAAKAQRYREKQLEKERKQKMKEEKAKDKQLAADIAQVNRLKVEKKDSTPEMILDLSSSFKETSVGNQALEYMRLLGVEHTFFDSSIRNVVKWRRKMKARYNRILGYWEPCEQFIREEEHVLCFLTAQEFVDMVTSTLDSDTPDAPNELELHVLRLKSAYPKCTPIYLIEGLTAWMRKNTNSRNRAYQAELRHNLNEVQGTQSTQTTSTSRRKKKTNKPEAAPIDDDTIEDALLSLQISHNCLIHQTTAPPDSAEWLKTFTEHISTVPYRRERMNDNDSAFCMDTGQVKPGENASDAYVRMLQEVSRVTASMAYGIANEYPSVMELVKGMRRNGPVLLEDVKKSANKNGALTEARVGPAASRRLYKVFMSLDPASTDI